ncbi:MAG: hypothetical protein IJT01_01445 [Selenomonadaceae bacterium]|nr:hypothetical protein [Selenomonadaceae bacterium]
MKMLNLQKLFLVFALVLGLAVAGSPSADAKDLSLVNKTGEDIIVLNCSPTISDTWYNDVLGNSIWRNGETITLDFDRWALSDTWDFKVHYGDGYSEDWYGVNVRTVNTIILHRNGVNEYL